MFIEITKNKTLLVPMRLLLKNNRYGDIVLEIKPNHKEYPNYMDLYKKEQFRLKGQKS